MVENSLINYIEKKLIKNKHENNPENEWKTDIINDFFNLALVWFYLFLDILYFEKSKFLFFSFLSYKILSISKALHL